MRVFYQNEDLWQISSEIYGTEEQTMSPNYYIMKLPGEDSAEFVNSIPFTPKDKKNLMGLFVARNDGGNYGELILYQMPKSQTVYGPMQIEAQIDQNTEIFEGILTVEFVRFEIQQRKHVRGTDRRFAALYQSLYIWKRRIRAYRQSRVIVVYGDKIAYEATLAEALNSMFGEGSAYEREDSGNTDTTSGGNGDELSQTEIIKRAQDAFDNAQNAQKNGDWAKYGEYLR